MTVVHLVLPNDIDNPAEPSGGNVYDRRISRGLTELGWAVHEHAVHGGWPRATEVDRAAVARVLAGLPDHTIVLLDGLVAAVVPEVLEAEHRRLRMVTLAHMPFGYDAADLQRSERSALAAMTAVVTTSSWTRERLLDLYALPAGQVHVACPGVDPAPAVPGSAAGIDLLCIAAVTPRKGLDVLARALGLVADLPWICVCVGSLTRDPPFVEQVNELRRTYELVDRMQLAGPRIGVDLAATYAAADLLVLPSLGESYGMVVTEALARGIPVVAAGAKGLPEALGHAPDGSRPGMLVPPGDPVALADAVRRWLTDPQLRTGLRRSAYARRATLAGWAAPVEVISKVLAALPPEPE